MLESYFGEIASGVPITRKRPYFVRNYSNASMNFMEEFEDLLIENGDFSRALTFQSTVHQQICDIYGDDHQRCIDASERLSIALDRTGRLAEAIDIERTVLVRRERKFGEDHAHTMLALKWLATMHHKHGDLDEAERTLRQLVDDDRNSKTDISDYVRASCRLVDVLDDLGKYDEARRVAETAISASDNVIDRMDASQWLGVILGRLREFERSLEVLREVVAFRTSTLGIATKPTVSSLIQLSNTLYLRGAPGDLGEARLLAEQARDVATSHWGADDEQAILSAALVDGIDRKEGTDNF